MNSYRAGATLGQVKQSHSGLTRPKGGERELAARYEFATDFGLRFQKLIEPVQDFLRRLFGQIMAAINGSAC